VPIRSRGYGVESGTVLAGAGLVCTEVTRGVTHVTPYYEHILIASLACMELVNHKSDFNSPLTLLDARRAA
jgi:hypothetical protein